MWITASCGPPPESEKTVHYLNYNSTLEGSTVSFWCTDIQLNTFISVCHKNASWIPDPVSQCATLQLGTHASHVYANKIHDLISTKKLAFWDFFIMYRNVTSDDIYQKIAQELKLFFSLCSISINTVVTIVNNKNIILSLKSHFGTF